MMSSPGDTADIKKKNPVPGRMEFREAGKVRLTFSLDLTCFTDLAPSTHPTPLSSQYDGTAAEWQFWRSRVQTARKKEMRPDREPDALPSARSAGGRQTNRKPLRHEAEAEAAKNINKINRVSGAGEGELSEEGAGELRFSALIDAIQCMSTP